MAGEGLWIFCCFRIHCIRKYISVRHLYLDLFSKLTSLFAITVSRWFLVDAFIIFTGIRIFNSILTNGGGRFKYAMQNNFESYQKDSCTYTHIGFTRLPYYEISSQFDEKNILSHTHIWVQHPIPEAKPSASLIAGLWDSVHCFLISFHHSLPRGQNLPLSHLQNDWFHGFVLVLAVAIWK